MTPRCEFPGATAGAILILDGSFRIASKTIGRAVELSSGCSTIFTTHTSCACSAVSTHRRDSRSDRAGASAQRRDLAVPVPYLAANETEAGAAVGVHRQHRVHQKAVNVAVADLAEAAAAHGSRAEFDLAGVLGEGLRRDDQAVAEANPEAADFIALCKRGGTTAAELETHRIDNIKPKKPKAAND